MIFLNYEDMDCGHHNITFYIRRIVSQFKAVRIEEISLYWKCLYYFSRLGVLSYKFDFGHWVELIWKHLPPSTAIDTKSSEVGRGEGGRERLESGTINDATEPQRPHSTIKCAVLKRVRIMMNETKTWAKGLWLTGICGNDFDRPTNHVSRLARGGYGAGRWGRGSALWQRTTSFEESQINLVTLHE